MPEINFASINWIAVVVAGLATFMLGGVWYTALFGKAWQRAHGFSDETVKKAQEAMNPAVFFGGMLVCYLIAAVGMAILIQWTGISTLGGGAFLGLIVGVLIVAPVVFTNHMPSLVKPAGFFIDAAFEVIFFVLMGAILGVWR